MTSPTPDPSPDRPPESRRWPWFKLGLGAGALVGIAGIGAGIWGWLYLQENLSPLVSNALTNALERPVELGELERLGLGSLRFGPSEMGPRPSADDPTRATAETVWVEFDLFEVLWTRTLTLDLELSGVEGYLEQDQERGWILFQIPEGESGRVKIRVDEILIKDSQVVMLPYRPEQRQPILFEQVRGLVDLDPIVVEGESAQRISFDFKTAPEAGGQIDVSGQTQPTAAGRETNLVVRADRAPLADALSFTLSTLGFQDTPISAEAGRVGGVINLAFRPDQPTAFDGNLSLDDGELRVAQLPQPIRGIEGETQFEGQELTIDRLVASYGELEAEAEGELDFQEGYDLVVRSDQVTVEDIVSTFDLSLPVAAAGTFAAEADVTGPLRDPRISGRVEAQDRAVVDQLTFAELATRFTYQGSQLFLDQIAAQPTVGGQLTGSGEVELGDPTRFAFDVSGQNLPANRLASLFGVNTNIVLGRVAADAQISGTPGAVSTVVQWRAPEAQYPGRGEVAIADGAIRLRDTVLQVAGGTVSGSALFADGRWNSDLALANVALDQLSQRLSGQVSGQVELAGTTQDFSPAAITGQGDLTFSQGLAAFSAQLAQYRDPLVASVRWNGEQLIIDQATSDRLRASGTITPQLTGSSIAGIERFNLDLNADDYALATLPVKLPANVNLAGLASFSGQLTGTPSQPQLEGRVRLEDFVFNQLAFAPELTGPVDFSRTEGLALSLSGGGDRIAVNYTDPRDFDFDIVQQGAFARGQTEGDLLVVEAGDFPLAALNLPAEGLAQIGQVRGVLDTANLAINLDTRAVVGDIAIDQLGIGYIGTDRFEGQVRFANNLATLTGGELTLGNSLYLINGRVQLGENFAYRANIEAVQGEVQDILAALSIYDLQDFARGFRQPDFLRDFSPAQLATILATSPTGSSEATVLAQLRRLAEIQALQERAAQADDQAPLPPLQELYGPFTGDIALSGGTNQAFNARFDLAGADWQWGENYSADRFIAKGEVTPNALILEPLRFESVAPTLAREEISDPELTIEPELVYVNLAGQFVYGRDTELTSNLQATAANLDITDLREILNLPLDVDGRLNAIASLGGNLDNPQLRGTVNLDAATINNTPVDTANAQFLFQNARLSLLSTLTTTQSDEPLTLAAQIPYAFDFMAVQPESDAIAIDVSVENEGLALLNAFNRQVAWDSGQGEVRLQVRGTLADPRVSGFANLQNAVLRARVLPDPLTNVNGSARFEGDRIIVENLSGQFSEGQLAAAGVLSLTAPIISESALAALSQDLATGLNAVTPPDAERPFDPRLPLPLDAAGPLTVNLQDIDLSLKGTYGGAVNGQVVIGGSILGNGPQLGGEMVLSQGQIFLPEGGEGTGQPTTPVADPTPSDPADRAAFGFQGLRVTLGDSVRIIQNNLLNFVAEGTLQLDGPVTAIAPQGTIRLRSGRVNLYTTIFQLVGSAENTATFLPDQGLQDPILDVELRASVPEVVSTAPIAPSPFASSEVADTSLDPFNSTLGTLRTIRVRASVEGPASRIFDNLTLTSSPSRSEAEIVGLIGGGFVSALESVSGGDSLQGVIGLVSSALLTRVQDTIGGALGLTEFRLFPVTPASRFSAAENNTGSSLDIAAEVGFDVSEDFSVSVLRILTDSTPTEFNLRYRLSDEFNVRTTTNLDDINQVVIEFETRF